MNIIHNINPDRIKPDDFIAVIEINKGGKNKYELDKETGMLIMDRVLYTSTHYPANYGFVPHTLALDGDPLDVFVFCSESIVPFTLVRCYPIGCITMIDSGKEDHKLLAVPFSDPQFNNVKEINQLPSHILEELKHFLQVYKDLEPNKKTIIDKVYDSKFAQNVIFNCKERYEKSK